MVLKERVDVVGPVCETGDSFLQGWPLGQVEPEEVVALWSAGAYGMVQASNYNGRARPAEVLVEGKRVRLIRRRERTRRHPDGAHKGQPALGGSRRPSYRGRLEPICSPKAAAPTTAGV